MSGNEWKQKLSSVKLYSVKALLVFNVLLGFKLFKLTFGICFIRFQALLVFRLTRF